MKVAVSGKGGVGKTLISATLARLLARKGFKVLTIDADPSMNLGSALGVDPELLRHVIPISQDDELIEERTGRTGDVFRLNPYVADVVDERSVEGPEGVRLLVMGTVSRAEGGCLCPANALVRALTRHILLRRDMFLIMDMEAGVEHLGRGTAKGFDAILDVVEPSVRALDTALRIEELALEMNVGGVKFVANKVSRPEDLEFIKGRLGADKPLFGWIPLDPMVIRADMEGKALLDYAPNCPALRNIEGLASKLLSDLLSKP
ncbi:MAG: AAA family ATPase [Candidatus Bathyarchaeia archaeon]